MTTLRTSRRTEIGLVRENNEDVIVSSDRLALVADGLGGAPRWRDRSRFPVAGFIHTAFTGQ